MIHGSEPSRWVGARDGWAAGGRERAWWTREAWWVYGRVELFISETNRFGRFLWNMIERPWFAHKDFTSLEIRKHKSLADHGIVKAIKISDVRYINELVGRIEELVGRIEQIPANGDMMISFSGAAEHIELIFYSEGIGFFIYRNGV